jgi:hypothetical protein
MPAAEASVKADRREPRQRCVVIDDTVSNLAAIQFGIVEDVPYRHP